MGGAWPQEEARERQKKAYTPAQEAARRAAAEDIRRQHLGWFANAFASAYSSMQDTVLSSVDDDDAKAVGKRKRAVRWDRRKGVEPVSSVDSLDDAGPSGEYLVPEDGYSVPDDRALVLVSKTEPRRR